MLEIVSDLGVLLQSSYLFLRYFTWDRITSIQWNYWEVTWSRISLETGKLLIQSLKCLFQILLRWTYSEDFRDVNFSHVCIKHKKSRVNLLKKKNCIHCKNWYLRKASLTIAILAKYFKNRISEFWSEIPFTANLYDTETSQMICNTNKITGFFMIRVSTEICFRIDF